MSNFDRAFIKAFDKTESDQSKPIRRSSTRDVLLSISLKNQQGQTQRIEQPPQQESQSHLGGPHLSYPLSMAIGQQDVTIPETSLAPSSVIVLPLAETDPKSKPSERRDNDEQPNPEHNYDDRSDTRQNINLEEIRRIRLLEEHRAERARARQAEVARLEAEAEANRLREQARRQEEVRQQEAARQQEEARRRAEAEAREAARLREAVEAEQMRAQQILSITQPITTYVDSVARGEDLEPETAPSVGQPAEEAPAAPESPAAANAHGDRALECQVATSVWEPAWELDRIEWPSMSDRLLGAQIDYFAEAGDQLRDSTQDGLNVLAISSELRGEGRTTLSLCLARCAAAAGVRVAVIDLDIDQPGLASQLNLTEIPGWDEVLDGRTPLAESAVASLEDGVCIFPLSNTTENTSLSPANSAVSALIRRVAQEFELVIVDTGPLGDQRTGMFEGGDRCPIDAAVIVRDVRRTDTSALTHNIRLWRAVGVNAVGVVENFLPLDDA